MKTKIIDKFQIAGFIISTAISIGLIFSGNDTISSITLGLVLAILTQLFDIQIRISNSEEKLLESGALNHALYQDEWLLQQVKQIVNDYLVVKGFWFDLFKRRAKDSIIECRTIQHSLSEQNMIGSSGGPYTLGGDAIDKYAKKSLKAVDVSDINFWRSTKSEAFWISNANAVKRGLKSIRIFIGKPDTLCNSLDIFKRQADIGVDVYIAFVEDIPVKWVQSMMIIDDRVCSTSEVTSNGQIREGRITMDPVQVEEKVEIFRNLLKYARRPEELQKLSKTEKQD